MSSFLAPDEAPTDLNTVVFNLVANCIRLKDVKKGETDPKKIWSGSEGQSFASYSLDSTHLLLPAQSYRPSSSLIRKGARRSSSLETCLALRMVIF